jgi:hypothetical protein
MYVYMYACNEVRGASASMAISALYKIQYVVKKHICVRL